MGCTGEQQLRRRFPASSEVSHASIHSWPGKHRATDSCAGGRGLRVQQQLDFDADDAVDTVVVTFVTVVLAIIVTVDTVLAAVGVRGGVRRAVESVRRSARQLRSTVDAFIVLAIGRHAIYER
jgi:hypothetical protein